MVTVDDVPANKLIDEISKRMKEMNHIEMPNWAYYAKTGVHKEKAPLEEDWWFKRAAAILRSVYLNGPIGTSRLRAKYGGKKDRGSKPSRTEKGSGAIIRNILNQLETEGLIQKDKNNRGRIISPKGQSLLDNVSYEIMKKMTEEKPELKKYL